VAGVNIRFRFFHPKPQAAIEGIVRRHPKVRQKLETVAQEIAVIAKADAPVGFTGDYRDSIQSKVYLAADGLRGRVFSDDFKAGFIEFGTEDTPAFHTLQKAAQSTGLRWRPVKR
jgi:hypothetical protein